MTEAVVETYRFDPDDLQAGARRPGLSAFMRIRNGAAFLESSIRSHIGAFDEIVAVYNRSTDATPEILARLACEFGPRLRVFHYLPDVFPPGSEGHRREPGKSPRSLVTYYNFALAQTRFSHATKLDDDHLALTPQLNTLAQRIRSGRDGLEMSCFSGFNLARDRDGRMGLAADQPFSGGGDIGVFPVRPDTYFVHDPRFEKFQRGRLPRRFRGFIYWHLKYLKPDLGFGNYDLAANPNSRYARKLAASRERAVVGLHALPGLARARDRLAVGARRLGVPLPEKMALKADRWKAAADMLRAGLLLPGEEDVRPR